jgi:hypothetical protein
VRVARCPSGTPAVAPRAAIAAGSGRAVRGRCPRRRGEVAVTQRKVAPARATTARWYLDHPFEKKYVPRCATGGGQACLFIEEVSHPCPRPCPHRRESRISHHREMRIRHLQMSSITCLGAGRTLHAGSDALS